MHVRSAAKPSKAPKPAMCTWQAGAYFEYCEPNRAFVASLAGREVAKKGTGWVQMFIK